MTTAIEQAKREMYYALSGLKGRIEINYSIKDMLSGVDGFEHSLEEYLEQLRQQYEEMASTAHSRFESIQSLEAANQELLAALRTANETTVKCATNSFNALGDLESQLAKMTESRDMFRNLHQAATHASIERAGQASKSGQTSGDRASCEQLGAQKVEIEWDGEGLPPVGAVCEAGIPHTSGPDHEVSIIWIEGRVIAYHEINGRTYTWFAEDDGFYPPGIFEFRAIITPEQIEAKEREAAIQDLIKVTCISYGEAGRIHDAGYRKLAKPSCMHSFFAIGDNQMKCTFCGVGK